MGVKQRMEKTDKQTRMHACMWVPLVSSIKRQRVRVCVHAVCAQVYASARASVSVSSSKWNDNESTDTSKGPGKKREHIKREKMQNWNIQRPLKKK